MKNHLNNSEHIAHIQEVRILHLELIKAALFWYKKTKNEYFLNLSKGVGKRSSELAMIVARMKT